MKIAEEQMRVNEEVSAVTVEWRAVELRGQRELGRFTFQVGRQRFHVHPVCFIRVAS